MKKICTSLEQSKKLIELGIDVKSADIHWQYIEEDNGQLQWFYFPKDFSINENESIPAWSLTALEGLMPFHIIENINRFGFYQVKGFNKQGETYRFGYKTNNDSFLFETSLHNDVVDAAFEMVVWLKENGKL